MTPMTADRRATVAKMIRFGLVGAVNTALDFALLFTLVYFAHLNKYAANIVSTGICLTISFVLNRTFTFRSTGNRRRQLVWFVVVTLIGLWGVQSLLLWGVAAALREWMNGPTLLLMAKLVATVGSLTWNYVLYDRVVFTESRTRSQLQTESR